MSFYKRHVLNKLISQRMFFMHSLFSFNFSNLAWASKPATVRKARSGGVGGGGIEVENFFKGLTYLGESKKGLKAR